MIRVVGQPEDRRERPRVVTEGFCVLLRERCLRRVDTLLARRVRRVGMAPIHVGRIRERCEVMYRRCLGRVGRPIRSRPAIARRAR